MKWTEAAIRQECEKTCSSVGIELKAPVSLNGRLTRTLGRVVAVKYDSGLVAINGIEFSKKFIENSDDDTIRNVIKHECAHYCVLVTTNEAHGHDAVFKAMCKRLGTNFDTPSCNGHVDAAKMYKYTVKCENCGAESHYSRMTRVLRNLPICCCSRCKSNKLTLIQNY